MGITPPHTLPGDSRSETLRAAGWALLLFALVVTSGLATWSVRSAPGREPSLSFGSLPGLLADTLLPLQPNETPAANVSGALALAATLERVRGQRVPTPAGEVDRWILNLSLHHRTDVATMLRRKGAYEPLMREALSRHQVPMDLAFLAMIESGYEPSATSPVGAAGVWQFMPSTARSFGLEVSSFVDERRDPHPAR